MTVDGKAGPEAGAIRPDGVRPAAPTGPSGLRIEALGTDKERGAAPSGVPAPTKILLVDDNHAARYAVRRILEKEGYAVTEASNGREALERIAVRPDLLICDVNLPDADGIELARRLREATVGRLPILQLSATAIDTFSQVAGLEAGADAYLPGPVDPAVLVATVRSLLRAVRAEDAVDRHAIQWQSTFESISDGVVLLDRSGSIVTLNGAAARLLGVGPADGPGRRPRDLLDLPDLDDPALLTSPTRVAFEATTGERWLRFTFDPMTGHGARPPDAGDGREGTVVTIADVTDRKRTDLALAEALRRQQQQSEELARASATEQAFRQLIEAVVDEMPIGVVVADASSNRALIANGEMGRIVGRDLTSSEIVGAIADQAFHVDGRPYAAGEWPLARSLAGGETVRDEELDIERGDGTRATISVSAMPIRAEDGTILAAVATIADITRRREAETLRDAFIGVLSHELRTPITSIYGGSKVLLRDSGDLTPEVQRSVLEDLAGEAERLNRMVENLLVLARVERGVTLSGQEPILLQRLLPRIVAEEARQWPALRIELVAPDDIPTVAGDESFVDQVLRNYVSNAGKYGPPTGTVTIEVRTRSDAGQVEVAVQDEGAGIDDGEASRLFELFFRSSSVANKTSGSGIGLFVSRHLVEGMGGRVWARSRSTGGSEFGFSLPIYEVS